VFDTGIGISKENKKTLFKLFGKVMQSNKTINKEGIGLGLYITKNIAMQLGGTITVRSKIGEYTQFLLNIPVKSHFIKLRSEDA
jgi:signal transduction histidine kinase